MQPTAIEFAFLSQIPVLNSEIGETLRDWAQSTPVEGWIASGLAVLIAFLIGLLCRKGRQSELKVSADPAAEELRWRHEKLVLMERQEAERLARQEVREQEWIHSDAALTTRLKLGLSFLAEEAREIRQRIGTDSSRLDLVKARLTSIASDSPPRPEAIKACLEMADSQLERLGSARDLMRPISQDLIVLEEAFELDSNQGEDAHGTLKERLENAKSTLSGMPGDWQLFSDEADRQIRDLLLAGGEEVFQPICDILLIDGGATDSLKRGNEISLSSKIDDLLDLLDPGDEGSPVALSSGEDLVPSSGFAPAGAPVRDLNGHHDPSIARNGNRNLESPDEPENGELVLFRSNDVSIWGKNIYRGTNHRAREIEVIPEWANWISIRRMDTGEAVFTSTDGFSLSSSETPGSVGFNGSHELFYGARHLGMYSDACPNEVETRFTYGGWGFGHRVSEVDDSGDALQASGWAGKEIAADTVFEVALYVDLPETTGADVVLNRADIGSPAEVGQS